MAGGDDQKRFSELIAPHLSAAYALARQLTGRRADAEDVVQEACLRAFRAIGTVAPGSARPWLLTIVHNAAMTWLRKNRPTLIVSVDDLEDVQTVDDHRTDATPEAELIAKCERRELEKAIAALPPEYRGTLMLREFQGLDYREIAQVTGVPIGTVMSRLARARRRIFVALAKSAA